MMDKSHRPTIHAMNIMKQKWHILPFIHMGTDFTIHLNGEEADADDLVQKKLILSLC